MGIMDFVKSGVREMMIARPDDQKDLIVYKHPDATIPTYAQLTIDADEAAVFFRDGAVVGTLRTAGAGQRHQLSTQNVPFLSGLVDKFTGGNVFTTDLFFVTLRPIYNVRFGGELGYMEDPLLGEMVTPRIFGTLSFQVTDPEAFIVKYTGIRASDSNDEVLEWIRGLFMNSVKTVVGNICIQEEKSLLQIMPLQQQIAQAFMQSCPDLNEIGCRIVQMGQFNINLDDADEARLREAQAEIGAAKRAARTARIGIAQAEAEAAQRQYQLDQEFGHDARYVQNLAGGNFANYAAGRAMMGAGEGMAQGGGGGGEGGNAMMGGAGLGVGFGMANMMAQGMTPQAQGYPPQQGGYPPQQGGYPPQQGGYPPQQGAAAAPAGGQDAASLQAQLDKLTERLANGELSEELYSKLAARLEQRIAEMG